MEFPPKIFVSKAVAFSDKAKKNIIFPAYAQKKEDGARCLCFIDDSGVWFFSSAGKLYCNLTKLINAVKALGIKNVVLDGELLVWGYKGMNMQRQRGNGILNKSIQNTISKEEADKVHFVIWDCIPFSEYYGNTHSTYDNRFNECKRLAEKADPKEISVVESDFVNSFEEISETFIRHIKKGHEGIVIKNGNAYWEGKRNKNQIKMKYDIVSTMKVTGFHYGGKGTKYENRLGALECKTEDELVTVFVGTGLSDHFRQEFIEKFKDHDFKKHPIFVEVKSNGLIHNPNGMSLFLPRFLEIRFDKTEADTLDKIKSEMDMHFNLITGAQ